MSLRTYLAERLEIDEARITVIGSREDQREIMEHYSEAKREGVQVTGVPLGVDGTIVVVNLIDYDHAGDGEWLASEAFGGFAGQFEEPEFRDDDPDSDFYIPRGRLGGFLDD